MRIHPREERTKKAEVELKSAVSELVKKHELSEGEALRVVNAAFSDWIAGVAKFAIRMERHGNTNDAGGLE